MSGLGGSKNMKGVTYIWAHEMGIRNLPSTNGGCDFELIARG